jgi:Peptidase family S41
VPRLLLPGVTPEQHEGADTGWRSLLPLAQAPWSLRDAEQALRWRAAPELEAVLIDLRQTRSDTRHRLPDFFAAVRAGIAQHRPRNLVLDLRLNGGGDLTQARDFAESLPARGGARCSC